MIEKVKKIILEEKYCVLATSMNNKPYCSLMAYAVENDCRSIYMVTMKGSQKYRNLCANEWVSLLIDTRRNEEEKPAKALTLAGCFSNIGDEEKRVDAKEKLLTRHPELSTFFITGSSFIFSVELHSFLYLDGFTESHHGSFY